MKSGSDETVRSYEADGAGPPAAETFNLNLLLGASPTGVWTRSRRVAWVANTIILVLLALILAAPFLVEEHVKLWLFYLPHLLAAGGTLAALRFDRPRLAVAIGIGLSLVGLAAALPFFGGVSGHVAVGFPILVAIAGVLWSVRAAFVIAAASALALVGAALLEHLGRLPSQFFAQPLTQAFLGQVAALAVMLVVVVVVNRLVDATVDNAMRTHARFTAFVHQSPDALVFMDEQSRVQFMNPAAERLSGYGKEELIGKGMQELPIFPAGFRAGAAAMYQQILQQGGEPPPREAEIIRKNGTRVVVEVNRRRVTMKDGSTGLQYTIRDVSERRRAETVRVELEARLVEAQRMESIGQLAGGVAHDFNNLLTVILGQSELLMYQGLPDKSRDQLAQVIKAGERAKILTHQLLAFARKQMLAPKVLDANAAIRDLGQKLRALAGQRVSITFDLDPGVGPVRVDPAQFDQVITNLVANARDAMPGGGTIVVRSRPGSNVAVLSVEDTGQGMDEETRKRIFEPFFTTKQQAGATGLGLAVVDGVVSQHGGHIEVASTPGHGTVFRVSLPCVAPAASSTEQVTATSIATPAVPAVLLVEDESPVRDAALEILRTLGYRVVTAAGASEALISFGANRQDGFVLVLTDVTLPGESGSDLVKELRRRGYDGPALFMSGYVPEDTRTTPPDGRSDFLRKPFSAHALASQVKGLLGPPPVEWDRAPASSVVGGPATTS